MAKFYKKMIWAGAISAVGFVGFKMYQRISAIAKLSKSLPEFLNNVYGEKPKININMVLTSVTISVGFNQDIIESNEDIQSTVIEYIEDFYPALSKIKLNVDVFPVQVSQTKPQQDDCCDGDCGDDCECEEEKELEKD